MWYQHRMVLLQRMERRSCVLEGGMAGAGAVSREKQWGLCLTNQFQNADSTK
jgi:hypothetical protein